MLFTGMCDLAGQMGLIYQRNCSENLNNSFGSIIKTSALSEVFSSLASATFL